MQQCTIRRDQRASSCESMCIPFIERILVHACARAAKSCSLDCGTFDVERVLRVERVLPMLLLLPRRFSFAPPPPVGPPPTENFCHGSSRPEKDALTPPPPLLPPPPSPDAMRALERFCCCCIAVATAFAFSLRNPSSSRISTKSSFSASASSSASVKPVARRNSSCSSAGSRASSSVRSKMPSIALPPRDIAAQVRARCNLLAVALQDLETPADNKVIDARERRVRFFTRKNSTQNPIDHESSYLPRGT